MTQQDAATIAEEMRMVGHSPVVVELRGTWGVQVVVECARCDLEVVSVRHGVGRACADQQREDAAMARIIADGLLRKEQLPGRL